MAKKASSLPLESWTVAVGATAEEVKTAWQDLQRRGLAAVEGSKRTVLPMSLRRANSPIQRRLAAHLAGFLLTENSFIVRRAGDPPGSPSILNSRITVEHIAQYFKEGWGVTDIQRDLPQCSTGQEKRQATSAGWLEGVRHLGMSNPSKPGGFSSAKDRQVFKSLAPFPARADGVASGE